MFYKTQVAEANADHDCWERPEDMDTPRTAYKVDANNPGSDVAAETAAAFAAASMAFRHVDTDYSEKLLRTARRVSALRTCISETEIHICIS